MPPETQRPASHETQPAPTAHPASAQAPCHAMQRGFIGVAASVAFLAFVTSTLSAEVVVTDISVSEWDELITTHDAAWSVLYRGGSNATGRVVEEIRLSRNIATPQAGGGDNTLIGNLVWSRPTELEVLLDGAGNISARAGSTTVSDAGFAVTRSFNQILIRPFDSSSFGASDLQSLEMNSFEIRNIFADGTPGSPSNDIVSIHNFGSQAPFSFTANWDPGLGPDSNDQYVWIVALQNDTIPALPPAPPQLTHHWTPTGFELTAGALVAGREYRVMSSPDLSDWTLRHTFTAADPPQPHHWTSPLSPTGREFFRLEWNP